MLRIVIDTNIFVSGVISIGTPPKRLLRSWQAGQFDLVTCSHSIDELDDVLQRPHILTKYAIDPDRETLIEHIKGLAIFVSGTTLTGVVRDDPKDDMFVSCAVEGNAKYIVTGDKHLLKLKRYHKIRIITVAHFLAVLERCQRVFGN